MRVVVLAFALALAVGVGLLEGFGLVLDRRA